MVITTGFSSVSIVFSSMADIERQFRSASWNEQDLSTVKFEFDMDCNTRTGARYI